ncbi:hypothetical protein N7509_014233 [Penicillium cosmopolitanum]|uniref:Uncharacterized protein n=1 Tax=Penicillium cosmopolitanum TaxID=1131564 RepID=A0A9W9S0E9_9EURO|nr:uncharacterized protein N7509_014233 [Penicillium cosmopolitanum]KAJ5369621.1 hypothetical protein N7509_014233 [Penicillium cosmopolitanum]
MDIVIKGPTVRVGLKAQDLEYEDNWEAEDRFGQHICEQLNLGRGRPIMCHCTDHAYLFEAGGKFYFWYCVGLDVFEITSPITLDEIIKTMKEKGDGGVKTKRLV